MKKPLKGFLEIEGADTLSIFTSFEKDLQNTRQSA